MRKVLPGWWSRSGIRGLPPGWRLPESHLLHQSDRSLSGAALQAFSNRVSGSQTLPLWSLPKGRNCQYHTYRQVLPSALCRSRQTLHRFPPEHSGPAAAAPPDLRYSRNSGIPDHRDGDSQDVLSSLCSCHRAGAGKYNAHLKAQRSSSLAYLTFYHFLRPQHSLQFHYFQHRLQFLNQSLLFHNPSPLPLEKDTPEFLSAPLSRTVQIVHRRPALTSPLRSITSSELRFHGQARTVCCLSAVLHKDVPCTTPHFECIQDLHVRIFAVSLDYPYQR